MSHARNTAALVAVWILTGCGQAELGTAELASAYQVAGDADVGRGDAEVDEGDAFTAADSDPAGDEPVAEEHGGDAEGPDEPPGDTFIPTDDESTRSEFLLFDGSNRQFTYADNGFHVLLSAGDVPAGTDWSSPVDYYAGEFHVRYVVTAPSEQAAGRLQTCIWTMGNEDGDGHNYFPESCSGQASHTGIGEYYNSSLVPASWWKLDGTPLDFSHPERFLIRVVLRGTSGCNVTRYNVSNSCWDEWSLYETMRFRVTIVMVGPDDTFSGWENYP